MCAPVVHPAGVDAHGDSCHAEVLVETEPGHLDTDHIVSCCGATQHCASTRTSRSGRGEMHRWRHQYHGDGHKTLLIYHVFLGSKSSAIKCTSSIASNTNPLSIANTVAVTHHNERSTVPGPRPPTHPPHSTLGRCRALPALCYCN